MIKLLLTKSKNLYGLLYIKYKTKCLANKVEENNYVTKRFGSIYFYHTLIELWINITVSKPND